MNDLPESKFIGDPRLFSPPRAIWERLLKYLPTEVLSANRKRAKVPGDDNSTTSIKDNNLGNADFLKITTNANGNQSQARVSPCKSPKLIRPGAKGMYELHFLGLNRRLQHFDQKLSACIYLGRITSRVLANKVKSHRIKCNSKYLITDRGSEPASKLAIHIGPLNIQTAACKRVLSHTCIWFKVASTRPGSSGAYASKSIISSLFPHSFLIFFF